MRRILQVVSSLELGGTEAFIMNHYRNIDRNEYYFDFLVLCANSSPYEAEIKQLGGNVYYMSLRLSMVYYFSIKAIICKFLKENGPYDVVHSHINNANSFVMSAAASVNIPVRVSHSHNTGIFNCNILQKAIRSIQRTLIKKYSTVFCACGQQAGIDLYGDDVSFIVLKNGIDVKRYTSVPFTDVVLKKKELNISDNSIVYGNISRFDYQKNIPFVVKIFNEIQKKQNNSVLVIGGQDAEEKDMVLQLIDIYGIRDKVIILGKRTDMPILLNLFDVLLFPSRYEGLSILGLEAQAAGTPILASTSVPKEIDMGLGLVTFIDLKESPQKWADIVLHSAIKKISIEERIKCFARNGYEVNDSVKKLELIYGK